MLAIAYTLDRRLVLVRQYRSATDGYTLELPAGKVDPTRTHTKPSNARYAKKPAIGSITPVTSEPY